MPVGGWCSGWCWKRRARRAQLKLSLCEELRHNFTWVKRQNKTPKSKQTYRECYYRCLIKVIWVFASENVVKFWGEKKANKKPKHPQLQFMNPDLPIGVWGLNSWMSLLFLPQSSSLTFPGCSFHISCTQGWDQDHSARPWEGGFSLPSSSSPWVLSPGMLNISAFIKFDWCQMKSQKLVRGEWQVRSLFSLVIFQSGKKD